ncbi:hypothetical protein B0T22DRAFT_485178 [Podospora appendiculata]|uniref:Uncharacterized protein n=1 Tax=Podospora appendiculata TaxID=314037 RepID=A0AAE0WZY5_9PEZI|nr:hypothetical protein B0T22DRAFT_485178 [Podospora appendiculata]
MAITKAPSGRELLLFFFHFGLLFTSVAGQKIYQDYAAATRPKAILSRPRSPEFNASIIIDDTADAELIGHLGKRVEPVPDSYGPAFDQQCLICPRQELLTATGQELLDALPWYAMVTYMRKARTSRTMETELKLTAAACCGVSEPVAELGDRSSRTKDFYSIFDAGNWLNPILSVKNPEMGSHVPYFQQMSKAMAEQCSGEVVVLSSRAPNLGAHEWTTLKNNIHRITRLVAVDITPGRQEDLRAYELDLVTLEKQGELTGTGGFKRDATGMETEAGRLRARDTCSDARAAQLAQPAGHDFFGAGT